MQHEQWSAVGRDREAENETVMYKLYIICMYMYEYNIDRSAGINTSISHDNPHINTLMYVIILYLYCRMKVNFAIQHSDLYHKINTKLMVKHL